MVCYGKKDYSERPNHLKSSSAEPRSFGHLQRSFGRSFGRISTEKFREKCAFFKILDCILLFQSKCINYQIVFEFQLGINGYYFIN